MAAARSSFPVNLVQAVAGHVLTQLFKLAAASDLAHGTDPGYASPQRLQILVPAQIGVDADFHRRCLARPHRPQPERRRRFEIAGVELIPSSPSRRNAPGKFGGFGAARQLDAMLLVLSFDSVRRRDSDPHTLGVAGGVEDPDADFSVAIFEYTNHGGQLDSNAAERAP